MERENSLVPVNNLINKIDNNFKLVDKLLNTTELETWWQDLDNNWKLVFQQSLYLVSGWLGMELYMLNNCLEDLDKIRLYENYDKAINDLSNNLENISSHTLFCLTHKLDIILIERYEIFKLDPLFQLKFLKKLFINNSSISDLSPIYHLKSLTKLHIKNSFIPLDHILKFMEINPNCEIEFDET